jgi:hypothetical protein
MKTATIETETSPDDSDEKSSWVKFCNKRGINSNLIMLKVTLFVMYGGENRAFVLSVATLRSQCSLAKRLRARERRRKRLHQRDGRPT